MTGLDGISSLQKALSALKTTDSTSVKDAARTSATQAAGTQAAGKLTTLQPASTGRLDHTSLSAAAKVTGTSDVRLTRVAELRQSIGSGSYNVPSHEVASKIVDHLLG